MIGGSVPTHDGRVPSRVLERKVGDCGFTLFPGRFCTYPCGSADYRQSRADEVSGNAEMVWSAAADPQSRNPIQDGGIHHGKCRG